jgi:hypothetical protein
MNSYKSMASHPDKFGNSDKFAAANRFLKRNGT